ncbi:phage adaptor protein [Candidatus Poriferisocius sp.]|uniref:phage adaptor protein n=1 Tax=Candidatus Poriferisocius sp. TaxID=3101276 RepID=UPI003B5270D1
MITNYSELQSLLQDWLIKTGMSESVKDFITLAEGKLRTDPRVRTTKMLSSSAVQVAGTTDDSTVSLSTMGVVTMPDDFKSVVGWSIQDKDSTILMPGTPASFRAGLKTIGTPEEFIIVRDRNASGDESVKALVRPVPNTAAVMTYLIYRANFMPLSTSNASNWLLKLSPAIYVYSALEQSAPYLRDDPRLPTWVALKEDALNSLAAFETGSEEVIANNVIKLHQQPMVNPVR